MLNPSLEYLRKADARDSGIYHVADAAFYVGMHPNTLLSWVRGRTDTSEGPVIPALDSDKLSFYDIASAHVLLALRKHHEISLQAIRRSMAELRKHYGDDPYPLLNKDFRTDGKDVFIKKAAECTHNLSKYSQGMLVDIVDEHLDRIVTDEDGLSRQLFPLRRGWEKGGHKRIIIDPEQANGRPSIVGTGIPVEILVRRFKAGETLNSIAQDYAVETADVEEAVQFWETKAA